MKKIEKKVWPEYFQAISDDKKTFEIRLNDFEVAEGDTLVLDEVDYFECLKCFPKRYQTIPRSFLISSLIRANSGIDKG